jgi:hypothetical protein
MRLLCACLVLWPLAVSANGNQAHVWITRQALQQLPDGSLKRLLARPELENRLHNGTLFPDGGYVVKDDYGEMAHWEPFVEAYVRDLRARFAQPYPAEAHDELAFLFGVASHGMADETFDAMYMKAARGYDAANWSDELLDSFDSTTDVILAAETQQMLSVEPWLPPGIVGFYRDRMSYTVDPGKIDNAQFLLATVVLDYGQSAAREPMKVAAGRARYPWGSAHLLDASYAGSPPCEATIVKEYWLALWDRLHGEVRPENLLVTTVPRDGGRGHVSDHTRVESQLVLVFGSGIVDKSLRAEDVDIRDSQGRRYPIKVDFWGGNHSNVVRLLPQADWPLDEDLTVTLPAGITTIDANTATAPPVLHFSTRAAGAGEPAPYSDPTPHAAEPASSVASGCAFAPARSFPLVLLVPLLALFSRRARAVLRRR